MWCWLELRIPRRRRGDQTQHGPLKQTQSLQTRWLPFAIKPNTMQLHSQVRFQTWLVFSQPTIHALYIMLKCEKITSIGLQTTGFAIIWLQSSSLLKMTFETLTLFYYWTIDPFNHFYQLKYIYFDSCDCIALLAHSRIALKWGLAN